MNEVQQASQPFAN
ncbi:unnamed protein product, partial [Adineta steineri]